MTALEESKQDVTTKFVGSVAVEKNDQRVTTFSSPKFIKSMTTEYLMTLKKALCRPIEVAAGSWATTDLVGTDLIFSEIPGVLTAKSIVQKKLDGFQGIRGSITLRLQATANPFQQGLLTLWFYPLYSRDKSFSQRNLITESWSFWPRVELNLGKETACELRVPFTLPVSFIDLVTDNINEAPQMGAFGVRVYSPLKTGAGTASVGWNLYAHWNEDDLELFNPTPNQFQSGKSPKLTNKSTLPSDKEKVDGTISGALGAASVAAEAGTLIPVLADFAGPTAWALRIMSRVASTFGFARPTIDEKPRIVTGMDFPYNSNVEGPDVSMPLSLTVEPGLKIEPTLSGKTEDEMTIDYFCAKFGFQQRVNLDTTALAGQVLLALPLGAGISTVNELKCPKPYQLLSRMFKFWRGNLRVRVKFVKTKMHTGRLMFAFFPGVYVGQDLETSEYVHREIVDIATIEELVYELPFTSQYPYLECRDGSADNKMAYGSFQIVVVNTLQAPSSVVGNIDLIIETAMGEGSEWFDPKDLSLIMPTIPLEVAAVSTVATNSEPVRALPPHLIPNHPQSGQSPSLVQVTTLSDAQVTGHQVETAQLCVGEKLLSLRQLIKYPASMVSAPSVTQTSSASGTLAPMFYQPFAIGATSPTGTQSATCRFNDFLNLIAPYYRFSRGGMRVRGTCGNARLTAQYNMTGVLVFSCKDADNQGVIGLDVTPTRKTFGGDFIRPDQGHFKYTVPAWQAVPMVPHHYAGQLQSADHNLMMRQNSLLIQGLDFPVSTQVNIRIARQPADDYELISFIGPPVFTTSVS